jgi:phosphate transport system permease protein
MTSIKETHLIQERPPVTRHSRRSTWLKINDRLFKYTTWISASLLMITLAAIILFIAKTGFLVFGDVSVVDFFFSAEWAPDEEKYGSAIFIFGTLALTLLTLLIATPISVGIAVFMAEIAPERLKRALNSLLNLLVGIPSIVYGYLGLTVLLPFLRKVTGQPLADGLLASAIVLAIMVLPTITTISSDAISFVPREYREAAYGLGATRLQTIIYIILPAARNGIISAIILGMARALGETMAVVMVIGNVAQWPNGLFTPTAVLTSNIVMQILNVQYDSTWNYALYMMAFILLIISLFLIILIRLMRPKGV